MIEAHDIAVVGLILLIALIATVLRRRLGLLVVLWAISFGLLIAARVIKTQVMMRMQAELQREGIGYDVTDIVLKEAIEEAMRESTAMESITDEAIRGEIDEIITEGE